MRQKSRIVAVSTMSMAIAAAVASLSGCWDETIAQQPVFTLTSPDLVSGTFAVQYTLNGFGCSGQNISPELQWSGLPSGTKSLALQLYDPDAPTGSGFWAWNNSPFRTILDRRMGSRASFGWRMPKAPDTSHCCAGRMNSGVISKGTQESGCCL